MLFIRNDLAQMEYREWLRLADKLTAVPGGAHVLSEADAWIAANAADLEMPDTEEGRWQLASYWLIYASKARRMADALVMTY